MSDVRSGGGDSAPDILDAWMAHRDAPGVPEELVPDPPVEAPPTPETSWRGYVLPSVTAADPAAPEPAPVPLPVSEPVAVETEPVHEPEPDIWEPEPVSWEPEPLWEPESPVAQATEAPLGITAALAAAAAKVQAQPRWLQPPATGPLPAPARVVREREPIFAVTTRPKPPSRADDMPAVTEFSPREGNRTIAGLLLAASLVAATMACYLAWYDRSAATIGIGCTLFILVLIIWATRASSTPAHLKINSGHLTVRRTGTIRHFDLASKYTALEVHGRPGLPGWKVLIEQRDADAYVIDASMVNPRSFMRVLRYYRPGL